MRAIGLALVLAIGCSTQSPSPAGEATEAPPERQRAPERPRVVDEPRVVAPEPAPMAKVDLSLGNGFEMRRPIVDGRLQLIPIVAKHEMPAKSYITLHAGMARGVVSVRELSEDWEVDIVRITNKSNQPLLVMSGELLLDAKQDRVTAETTVITAGASRQIQVRCVEEEREHGGLTFHPGHAIAELALRQTVAFRDQDSVWAKVDQINRRHRLSPSTKTYRHAAAAQSKNGERRDSLMQQLTNREERQQMVGLAVAVDGKVIAVERFATPELYRQLEAELLASYLADTDGTLREVKKLSPDDVRLLLAKPTAVTEASFTALRAL